MHQLFCMGHSRLNPLKLNFLFGMGSLEEYRVIFFGEIKGYYEKGLWGLKYLICTVRLSHVIISRDPWRTDLLEGLVERGQLFQSPLCSLFFSLPFRFVPHRGLRSNCCYGFFFNQSLRWKFLSEYDHIRLHMFSCNIGSLLIRIEGHSFVCLLLFFPFFF